MIGRIPIRVRLTIAFAATMALLLLVNISDSLFLTSEAMVEALTPGLMPGFREFRNRRHQGPSTLVRASLE